MRVLIPVLFLVILTSCQSTKTPAARLNLAPQATTSASTTQVKWEGEGPVSSLTDGDLTTRWSSVFADASVKKRNKAKDDNQWVVLDFGDEYSITNMRVHWETAAAKSYDVQVSDDGKDWKTIHNFAEGQPGPRADDLTFDPTSTRYLRLKLTGRATEYGYSIFEIEVY
jgi:hypothetical protein